VAVLATLVFVPLGIVLAHIAQRRAERDGDKVAARRAIGTIIFGYAYLAIVVILVAMSLSKSSPPSGFNNVSTLQSSVEQQIDQNLANPNNQSYLPGVTVNRVLCASKGGTQYECSVNLSSGTGISVPVTVSSDGTRWVSNG
jgi:amino acid transporter